MKKILFLMCLGAGIATTVFAAKDNSVIGSYSVSDRSGGKALGMSMYSDDDTNVSLMSADQYQMLQDTKVTTSE